jgi:hypothetical protein
MPDQRRRGLTPELEPELLLTAVFPAGAYPCEWPGLGPAKPIAQRLPQGADQPRPWPPARYQFSRPRDWLVTVAPYAIGVLQVLRVAAKVGMPIMTLADVNLKGVKDDLEAMGTLLQQLPTPPPAHRSADPGQPVGAVKADGPELRALRVLLFELDPKVTFNGMHVVADKSGGDVRWGCQDHYLACNPGRPSVPAQASTQAVPAQHQS